jgi:transcriptional regulator with XRE-family HTH domain
MFPGGDGAENLSGGGETLGQRLRRARLAAGMSMRELATRAGVSQPFVSQVESGRSSPSLSTLNGFAVALDLAPGDLMAQPARDEIRVTRADEGPMVRTFDHPASARGRVIAPGRGPGLEFIEYEVEPGQRVDVWFQFPGELVVYVIAGRLEVEIEGRGAWTLGPRETIQHDALLRHRWHPVGDEPVRLVLAASRVDEHPALRAD